jgi:hypothetical protein
MADKIPLLIVFGLLSFQPVLAQDSAASITGKVDISIQKGTIDCDFIVTDIPRIEDYVIRLNSGMNIRSFYEAKYNRTLMFDTDHNDTTSSGESQAYYLEENFGNSARYLPQAFEVRYCGMFPVVPDSASGYQWADWRGNIAFNGRSLRTDGLQSAWYPILFDLKRQIRYEKVKFDVAITCSDCSVLFANGCEPVRSHKAEFVSKIPQEMAIYCGDFETTEIDKSWLLNADMSKEQQRQLLTIINSYKTFYGERIGIPYKGSITYVNTAPTADPSEWAFSFVVSPTIINVGLGKYGLGAAFDEKQADFRKETIAHELAHYYFGTLLRVNTQFGNVIDEGFAEFMAFEATRNRISDSAYRQLFQRKLKAAEGLKITPFSMIRSEADYNSRELYLYYFTPIVLTAVEKEIGEEAMWAWLRTMVGTRTDFTDYAFFESTFDKAVRDTAKAAEVKRKYFTSDQALQNAIVELSK